MLNYLQNVLKPVFSGVAVFFMLLPIWVNAQVDTSFLKKSISYHAYNRYVGQNNFNYAVEKFNVNMADANVLSASIFPDPELGFGWFDNGNTRMGMGYGFVSDLSWTVELGRKRKARMDLAKSEYTLAQYLLQDYFRNLRADAAILFLEAMQNRLLLNVQINSYQTMYRLAMSDSIRYRLGSITEVDARQSKLESRTMLNDVYQADAVWKMSLANLPVIMGYKSADTLFIPTGNFNAFDRDFNLNELITAAQNQRADLLAALQSKEVSKNLLKLAHANRVADLGISLGNTYASYTRNIVAPTPSFYQIGLGVSIPLKFSNNKPGELKSAYYAQQQAEAQYRQIELEIQASVTQAYYNYLAQQKQVQQFNNGLLNEAKLVLDGKIYSYQRGETTLLEVLNAQRTYNGVQQAYFQTLFNYASALVELERAAGIWDIDF